MLLTLAAACTAAFSALCAATVAAFLVLVMIPRLHSPVRAWLRPRAVERVESGLVLVAAAQRLQRPWLTWLFQHSSHTVSVTFYVRRSLGGGAWRQRRPAAVAGWPASAVPPSSKDTPCTAGPALQASFLPVLFWLGFPELGRDLVLLVRRMVGALLLLRRIFCSEGKAVQQLLRG